MNAADIYERRVRPLLFSLEPETAHHLALGCLRVASRLPLALRVLRSFRPLAKPRTLFGINFPNPIGLAAGFDKNGVALPAWAALGFGFIEIGTVTAKAQAGNPKPRIFRYPQQGALINRLGFNNDGADVVAARLRKLRGSGRWPRIPVGINLGKSKITPLEEAAEDYLYSFRLLREFADYIVLNVSSPNTPGLRTLQEHDALQQLLGVIRKENQIARKRILLKIAPDLSIPDLEQIIATCEENDIAGIIATNTTLDHMSIPPAVDQAGGLSGRPLREKSTELVRAITTRSRLPVIASGGISDAESAKEKLEAGAQLLQIYTGFVYGGPGLLRKIVENL
ncbi:MAG: dihydroorotate dehydrogenase [Verrucomicrobiota bacterium]|jgi:dihydroorotate dehydrogenase